MVPAHVVSVGTTSNTVEAIAERDRNPQLFGKATPLPAA